MNSKFKITSLYEYIFIILILVALAVRGGAEFKWLKSSKESAYSLGDFQKTYEQATSYEKKKDGSIKVLDEAKNTIGYALVSTDFDAHFTGYAGETPLLILFDKDKTVTGVQLLSNQESPGYIEYVKKKNLFNAWDNQMLDSVAVALSVDAVSGATFSSKAIINTVRKTMSNYLAVSYQQQGLSWQFFVKTVLVLLLVILSLSMVFKKTLRKYYWYYLIAVVLVFGFWMKQMLSTEILYNWLLKGAPIETNYQLIIILILAIVMSVIGHKKYYCNYLCPMGAIQTLVSKISPFKKSSFNFKISVVKLRAIYLTFIWCSLILGYTLPLADMEPFKAFSFSVASAIMIISGVVIVLLSLFFNRPWCQLCPTGCLLDSVSSIKSKN